ncbi:hypothetical protein V1524DRAFT_410831 [Lipomyces starkeyi]
MSDNSIDAKSAQEWDENIDHVTAVSLAAAYVPGSPAEKKLLRKLDFRVVPCCWLLFVLGYLDRANIGFVSLYLLQTAAHVADLE